MTASIGAEQNGAGQVEKKLSEIDKRIAELEKKKKLLELKNDLNDEKFRREIAPLKREEEKKSYLQKKEMTEISLEENRIRREISRLKLRQEKLKMKSFIGEIELSDDRLDLLETEIKLSKREREKLWDSEVNKPVVYRVNPLKNGVLKISDRRINLNGVVTLKKASHIADRLQFFNNKSSVYPVFIVIDYSPGGSVMAGYQIIKAMQSSKAPVIVVVKSFAASMAAIIAGFAEKSYAFDSAMLLHHQVSGYNAGNIRQQKERLEITEEWAERLLAPIARRMGITLKQFVDRMYKNNSDGDWVEFADRAAELRWITATISEIEDESVRVEPVDGAGDRLFQLKERHDDKGRVYVKLPRLLPYDVYHLYNRDNYYRLP